MVGPSTLLKCYKQCIKFMFVSFHHCSGSTKTFNARFFNCLLVVFQGIKGSPGAYGASGDKGRKGPKGTTFSSNCRKMRLLIQMKGLYRLTF